MSREHPDGSLEPRGIGGRVALERDYLAAATAELLPDVVAGDVVAVIARGAREDHVRLF